VNAENILFYFVPPIVGAVIGLFTNWLAIKMLFRPLTEKRILGLRVPFTPGMLPRERGRMARSMAETVATDLLDDKTLTNRLRSPGFKDSIRLAALEFGQRALEARPSEIAEGFDRNLFNLARESTLKALAGLSTSEAFTTAVIAGSSSAVQNARELGLAELVPPAFVSSLSGAVSTKSAVDKISSSIADAVMAALDRAAAEGKSVSSLFDVEMLGSFTTRIVDRSYPAFLDAVSGILGDKEVTASMEKIGVKIIKRTFERFNSVQRFFMSLGQYDKAIMESMPATIADFAESARVMLAEAATRKAIIKRISQAVVGFVKKPLADMEFLSVPGSREAAHNGLVLVLSEVLSGIQPESIDHFGQDVMSTFTVGEILDALPGLSDRIGPAIAAWLSHLLGNGIDGQTAGGKVAASFFSAFASSFKAGTAEVPLGKTVLINGEALAEFARAASDGLSELAAVESAGLLRSLDIRSLVVEKIDSLDMIQVEKMLLRVIDRELGAITILGGVLGAVIGMLQTAFMLFR